MDTVSVRELRNHGGRVLQRVAGGESLVVTMDGAPVAELRPLAGPGLSANTLIERRRHLPTVNLAQFREDLATLLDDTL